MTLLSASASAPVSAPASRRERMTGPVVAGTVLGGLVLALHLRDPHQDASWGLCPSAVLGLSCPGCGGLRAVNDLTRGDLGAAASSNLLFVVSIPLIVFLLGRWTWDRWRGRHRIPDPRRARLLTVAYAVVAVGFAVVRNLPGSWLAP